MGNSNKSSLRKSQSVPNTQELSPDAQVLAKEKSLSQHNLDQKGKGKSGKKNKHQQNAQQNALPQLPPSESAFLPDFPLRGDLEELDFEVIDVIAKGAYGNVIKVQREDQKRFYAMKVLDKAQIIHEGAIRQCKDEAAIQSMAGNHPLIVKAHEYWQSRRSLYIVLDYIPHGDMFTLWTFHGAFPENLVRLYIAEMALVIDYLHNSSVIYRDVKMENILFNAMGHIQITDFGLAKWLQGGDQTRTVCGTLQYMAPEVLSVYPYGHSADWWSVGILMYAMLAGKYPVDGADTHTKMAQKVFDCDYLLPSHISDSAQDVINRVLTKSPHKRLCDMDTLQDLHFFQDIFFPDLIDQKLNPVDVVPEDFFPMTGVSWAPHVITHEEQRHFDEFDDSYETVTNDPDYQSSSYGQQRPHQPDIHPGLHPSQPYDDRQPPLHQEPHPSFGRQQSVPQPLPRHSVPQQQVSPTDYGFQPPSQSSIEEKHLVNNNLPSASKSSAQYFVNKSNNEAGQDARHSASSVNNPYSRQNSIPVPQQNVDPRRDVSYDRSSAGETFDRNHTQNGYPDGVYRQYDSSIRRSNGGDDRAYRPNNINSANTDRRYSGGGGLDVRGTAYPTSATSPVRDNNSSSSAFKTIEPPVTVTLKSPSSGFQSQQPFPQAQSVYPSHPTTPPTYSMDNQAMNKPSSATGFRNQNRVDSNPHPDPGYKLVEAPPTVTLPTMHNNFSLPNKRNIEQQAQGPGVNLPGGAPHSNYRRSEEISASLNTAPVLQAPQVQMPSPVKTMQAPAQTNQPVPAHQRPVVPVKPTTQPKPSVAPKPSASVRPIPAPRKSLRAQNHQNIAGFNQQQQQQVTSPTYNQGPYDLSFNRGSYIAPSQSPSYDASFSPRGATNVGPAPPANITGGLSYRPPGGQVLGTQAVPNMVDQGRPRSGSSGNIISSAGHSDSDSLTRSPSVENNSFKWKLPAGATPSFV